MGFDPNLTPEVRSALFDFQQYLSDKLSPLVVADAIAILVQHPPELAATEIHAWITAQYRSHGATIPLSDFIYHAVRKVHTVGEFRLVAADVLQDYLRRLVALLMQICPEEDREALAKNINLLGEAQHTLAAPVEIVHRQAGSEKSLATSTQSGGGPAVNFSDQAALSLRRFTRLLERWNNRSGAADIPLENMQSQLLENAVSSASNVTELNAYLARVRASGIDTAPEKMLKVLGNALPPWAVPLSSAPEGENIVGAAGAMQRIVTMAEEPGEAARRFRHMVRTAIHQFNEGSLARAATIFELAERIATEHSVNDAEVSAIRSTQHEALDPDRLKAHMERRESHVILRKVLNFFTPYRLGALFDQLHNEQARERRRFLMAMLEVYGAEARAEASRMLEALLAKKPETDTHFLARNYLYLLSRIPRPSDVDLDKELTLLGGFSSLTYRAIVAREAISILSQIKDPRAEKILIARLRELEAALVAGTATRYNPREAHQLLDRIVAALGRIGSDAALTAVLDHGLTTDEQLGDARARLAALGSQDLSLYPPILDRLLGAIRAELPRKLLAVFGQKKGGQQLPKMIDALAGTTGDETAQFLRDIASRYASQDFGRTAQRLLDAMGAAPKPKAPEPLLPTLSGDLELVGLPNLLQSLAEMSLTGTLSLIDQQDGTVSTISLLHGGIARCQRGALSGKEALFQTFDRSNLATFSFVSKREEDIHPDGSIWGVAPLMLEAMQRYDELKRARVMIPPSATLRATGSKPPVHSQEDDPRLVRDVWVRASSGEPPAAWEADVGADAWRIWRLLEFWVDNGALQVNAAS